MLCWYILLHSRACVQGQGRGRDVHASLRTSPGVHARRRGETGTSGGGPGQRLAHGDLLRIELQLTESAVAVISLKFSFENSMLRVDNIEFSNENSVLRIDNLEFSNETSVLRTDNVEFSNEKMGSVSYCVLSSVTCMNIIQLLKFKVKV